MKNKVIFRIISLALIAIMCMGIVSCANSGGADTTDTSADTTAAATEAGTTEGTTASTDNGGNGEVKPTGEEAMFAEILKAYEASMAYDGAFTMNALQQQTQKGGEENSTGTSTMFVSLDPEKNIFLEKESMVSEGSYGGSYDMLNKTFVIDGVVYEYDKNQSTNSNGEKNEDETYYKNAESVDDNEINEYMDYMLKGIVGGTVKAESYAAFKAAFAKVFSEVKARATAEFIADGELKEGQTISVEPIISIKQENGEIVLTITSKFSTAEIAYGEEEIIKNYSIDYTRIIAAKDGKISRVVMDYSGSANVCESAADEGVKFEMGLKIAVDMKYAFDQAAYDAIPVTLPTDPAEIVDATSEDGLKVTWHIGTIEINNSYYNKTEDVSYLFDEFSMELLNELGYEMKDGTDEFGNHIFVEDYNVTIKGFYKDAALTQAIDTATITADELAALGDVYVDVDVKEGMAIVMKMYGDYDNQLSLEYQIVMAELFVGNASPYYRPFAVPVSEPYDIRDEGSDRKYKVIINGVETEGDTVMLESGKIYNIEQRYIITDADQTLEFIIPEIF